MFPKHYKIKKSPEQKAEKKAVKEKKRQQKIIKEMTGEEYNENQRYFDNANRYRKHVNDIKDTHCYSDPVKRLIRISKEAETELSIMESNNNDSIYDVDPYFDNNRYRSRPGGMALLKQIELELQSRLIDDDKNYGDDIIIKKYKKRRKKNKKKKKKDLESILHLD